MVTVSPGRVDLETTIRNTSSIVQPVNIGWHPYLHRSSGAEVHLPARSVWMLDRQAEPTPTGQILPVCGRSDFARGRRLTDGEHWDHVFTDLISDESGRCKAWVDDAPTDYTLSGREPRCRRWVEFDVSGATGRPIRNLQLFTPGGRNAICLEPLSAPPDAINLLAAGHPDADVCVLEPGESARFAMGIGIDVLSS